MERRLPTAEVEFKRLVELMEEFANALKEGFGERQPGEIGGFEKSYRPCDLK